MISIIIPVLNQLEMTYDCIQSIRETVTPDTVEIIVVDNGSTPAMKAPFTGFLPIKIIRNEENKGFPVAVNQGIRASKGDVIILLNNDTLTTPDALDKLAAALETFDIVAPVTNYCAGLQKVNIPVYNTKEQLNISATEWATENQFGVIEVNWIIGFCMAFKRMLYDELGDFDEGMWPSSGEEIDFCFRAKSKGYSIGIIVDSYIHHFGSVTFKDLSAANIVNYDDLCVANSARVAEKWGGDFWNKQLIEESEEPNGESCN
jgi:GT2 family glycosyltransferase